MNYRAVFFSGSTAMLDAVETAGNFGIDAAHAVDYRTDNKTFESGPEGSNRRGF